MSTLNSNVGIILLAAGSSSRMGHNKMMYVHKGKTLLEFAIQAATISQASDIVVVTGANREKNESIIKMSGLDVKYNKQWEAGIGSSIKCGLNYLIKKEKALDAVIVSVCDQPYLSSEIFDNLIRTYYTSGKKIVASAYADILGVPVLYDKSFFKQLQHIPDEKGARKHLFSKTDPNLIGSVPFPQGEIDIDTLEDLKKIMGP
jgi:molybdenum cofactor cytidylyltransferase